MSNLKLNLGPQSLADLLPSRIPKPAEKKKTVYRFQEVCGELSKLSGLPFGTCLCLWKRYGNQIEQFLGEIKQGEHSNPKAFLLSKLKK